MSNKSVHVSRAYHNLITRYFMATKTNNIKDLDDFILSVEQSLQTVSHMLSGESSKLISEQFNLNVDQSDAIENTFLKNREDSITYAKTIMDYLSENDTNKAFLSGYIKHITQYFHYLNKNMFNFSPYFQSQLLLDMLTKPSFVEDNGDLTAIHGFVISHPSNRNLDYVLFGIELYMGAIEMDGVEEIIVNEKTKIKHSSLVNNDIQYAIDDAFRNLTINHKGIVYKYNESFYIVCPLDDNFNLILYLPKEYFTLRQ